MLRKDPTNQSINHRSECARARVPFVVPLAKKSVPMAKTAKNVLHRSRLAALRRAVNISIDRSIPHRFSRRLLSESLPSTHTHTHTHHSYTQSLIHSYITQSLSRDVNFVSKRKMIGCRRLTTTSTYVYGWMDGCVLVPVLILNVFI